MAFDITRRARLKSEQDNINPQLILELEGVPTTFGTDNIVKLFRYNDKIDGEVIEYGDGFEYGGFIPIEDQSDIISFDGQTSKSIKQTLKPDKGKGSTISNIQISLIDKDLEATKLITPGQVVPDILGRNATIYLGFTDTAFPDDYIIIFRGQVDEVLSNPGLVTLSVSHPDNKKRNKIYKKADTELSQNIDDSQTNIPVADTEDFLEPITGPDGNVDSFFRSFVRIDDEIIEYDSKSSNSFNAIKRGALETDAASHDQGKSVESFYVIEGNVLDIALKLMLSGFNGAYKTGVDLTNFVRVDANTAFDNVIFFNEINVERQFGIVQGDFVTTTGASNSQNNVTLKKIESIVQTDRGSYIRLLNVSFVEEQDSDATISFRSQYDTLPDGMQMSGFEVDVKGHEEIRDQFFIGTELRFFFKDDIDGKEFLEEQVYNPLSLFSIPRKAKASVGLHQPPLPTQTVKRVNENNVTNPDKLQLKRSISKNFFNTIIYKFNEQVLEDRFIRGRVVPNATSLTRIPVGSKALTIESKGLRTDLKGSSLAEKAANRRLRKYKFGAEFLDNVKVNWETGFNIDIGDIVIFDLGTLKISDIQSATRSGDARLFEVINKKLNIQNGDIDLEIVDTNFDKDARFGVISPASFIKSGISQREFIIKESFGGKFGRDEFLKWQDFLNVAGDVSIIVRNNDFSVTATAPLLNVQGNRITLTSDLGFVPSQDQIMELAEYPKQPPGVNVIYVFISDADNDFNDGQPAYEFI